MVDIQVEFYDFSYVRIVCENSVLFDLKDYFSFFADGYQWNPKFKYGTWSGKIHLLENNGLLPIGLCPYIAKFAKNMGYSLKIDSSIFEKEDITREKFDQWVDSKKYFSGENEISPYWYQRDAVFEAVSKHRALLVLPTSAGKSLIQAMLSTYYLENYTGKVLILVPTTSLTVQMKQDFIDYRLFKEEDILEIRSGTKRDDPKAKIYVSTWQTAIKQPAEWFSKFGMLLNDECHKATGPSISTIIKGLTNCIFKVGLTGTLKDGKANIMQYEGLFGQRFKPTTTKQLMEEGQATNLKINAIILNYPELVKQKIKELNYSDEVKAINGYKKRTMFISNLASKISKNKDENIFVMFKFKEHGKELYEEIKKIHGDKVYLVSGDNSTKDRNILKTALENQNGSIVVASYGVFSTGISIKNLHHVIFAHGVKDKITVLQSIGRILRNHSSKDVATLWDIIDDAGIRMKKDPSKYKYKNYLLKHAIERIERYASENFDYSIKKKDL